MFLNCLLSVLLLFASSQLISSPVRVDHGPLHDAFLVSNAGHLFLKAAPTPPPTTIMEKIPAAPNGMSIWVPGYWDWFEGSNDFVWVPGMWRLPPPERFWIPGSWIATEQGWVRVHGFWSDVTGERIKRISEMPPENLEENPPPAQNPNDFWMPGFWNYNWDTKTYQWVEGEWTPFDPNWMFVPTYYIWRPEGYIHVKGYWDWPIENVGIPYACVLIPANERSGFVYTPDFPLEQDVFIPDYFVCYPNFVYFFHHHFFFHRSYWDQFDGVPTWWYWKEWWAFNPHQHWGVWWWWTHPQYPQPTWMTAQISSQIAPPPESVIKKVSKATPPLFVTSNGVLNRTQFLNALRSLYSSPQGANQITPVLPGNPNMSGRVRQALVTQLRPLTELLQPTGKAISRGASLSTGPLPAFQDQSKFLKPDEIKKGMAPPKPVVQAPIKNEVPLPSEDKKKPIIRSDGHIPMGPRPSAPREVESLPKVPPRVKKTDAEVKDQAQVQPQQQTDQTPSTKTPEDMSSSPTLIRTQPKYRPEKTQTQTPVTPAQPVQPRVVTTPPPVLRYEPPPVQVYPGPSYNYYENYYYPDVIRTRPHRHDHDGFRGHQEGQQPAQTYPPRVQSQVVKPPSQPGQQTLIKTPEGW